MALLVPAAIAAAWLTSTAALSGAVFTQQLLVGTVERGVMLAVFGIWAGSRRVIFTFYTLFALGAAFCCLLAATEVSPVAPQRLMLKRDVNSTSPPDAPR